MNTQVMNNISYGLYLLTAREQGKDNGCIINTLQQVTVSPCAVSVTVNKENHTHDMILRTGKFNVSMLSTDSTFDVFETFGFVSGREKDKFAGCKETGRSENGICYLTKGTNSYLSAEVFQTVDLGSHTMFLAKVTESEMLSKEPSLTYAYYHQNIKPKPQPADEKKKGYRCIICGYVYEGDTLPEDFVCPWCKHGPEDFERIE